VDNLNKAIVNNKAINKEEQGIKEEDLVQAHKPKATLKQINRQIINNDIYIIMNFI